MAAGFIHTVFADGSWINTVEAEGSVDGTFSTKEDAVAAGRDLARSRSTEHVIHNQDGTISERNSYGNDPAHRPG